MRIDDEQRNIGAVDRRLSLLAHPSGQRLRVLILKPGGIDETELEPQQIGIALTPVARDAGPVIDQRNLLADEPVDQRRFTDIGAACNCQADGTVGVIKVEQIVFIVLREEAIKGRFQQRAHALAMRG